MIFKEAYTTEAIKSSILLDSSKPKEEKDKEEKKTVVSNDSYLNAEMTENLINKIEHLRLSLG